MISKLLMTGLLLSSSAMAGIEFNLIEKLKRKGNFDTLVTLLETTKLDSTLERKRNLTVFAPTDEAFAKIPSDVLNSLLDDTEALKDILLYHVARPKMSAKKVANLSGVKTLSGKLIMNYSSGSHVVLNDSNVVESNIKAKNGVIHALDKVLIPNESTPNNTISTVDYVNIQKYMGKWYELYRLPNKFEQGCYDVTADYALMPNGKVSVKNTCYKADGSVNIANGTAKVVNTQTNASLKVSFVPFLQRWVLFGGDYNILALGDDYEYVLVGSKDRNYLWILSRTEDLEDETIEMLKTKALNLGYRIDRLIKTPNL